jgi:hypothetical protein
MPNRRCLPEWDTLSGNSEAARQQTATALGYASFEFLQSMAALTQDWIGDLKRARKS